MRNEPVLAPQGEAGGGEAAVAAAAVVDGPYRGMSVGAPVVRICKYVVI